MTDFGRNVTEKFVLDVMATSLRSIEDLSCRIHCRRTLQAIRRKDGTITATSGMYRKDQRRRRIVLLSNEATGSGALESAEFEVQCSRTRSSLLAHSEGMIDPPQNKKGA